ncbi:ATPase, T2SS/T4P/T4SS family [Mucisphaera calidilacus]|uniref:Type II secretion system protein E n=1 Tax=Mucisphaera calidilacus TaxID=2527982 RepID=A0A518C0F6_9BACT|nr:ATPase, T2SS/T4P/T4SS family [Mucisphaera calidilacus]QDU72705.1 Putative type II secretion system protein E [Mucisphaera calidilacus]
MPILEVISEDGVVRRFELDSEKVTIGRHADNRIKLDDHRMSRFHCELAPIAEGYQLRDLGSSNGTRIGEQAINKAIVRPGQAFVAGRTRFRLIDPDARTAASVGGAGFPGGLAAQGTHVAEAPPQPKASPAGTLGSIKALTKIGRPLNYDESRIGLINARGQTVHAAELDKQHEDARTALHLLRILIYGCARTGASDIHVEPKGGSVLVRLRIDGTMISITQLDDNAARQMMSLVKVLCEIDLVKRAEIQEGHLKAELPDRKIDFRISFTPVQFGQKLVARVLDSNRCPAGLDDLHLPQRENDALRRAVARESGMILICGPTGSGKTTTLYAALRELDAGIRNIVTIEDPVEYELQGLTQTPVNAERDHTFSKLLRSCLRQDPDVVVVGEIRDSDTAVTAMQAGNTGHLVLSTIHAQNAVSTLVRLLDLGVEPYMVASTVTLVLAQRLVRTLCPRCRRQTPMRDEDIARLGQPAANATQRWEAVGCRGCYGTGYQGRRAIFELMPMNDGVRDAIMDRLSMSAIKQAAMETGLRPMIEHGAELVVNGITSLDEIDRVTGSI